MGLRLIEVRLPGEKSQAIDEALSEIPCLATWSIDGSGGFQIWHVLAQTEQAEDIVEALEERFSDEAEFRLILFDIAATVPRPQREDEQQSEGEQVEEAANKRNKTAPINIEELYEDIDHGMQLSWNFAAMVAASAVVAAVGIYHDNLILVIAAMIIAPLLYPNMGLSLATTLADRDLGVRAAKVNFLGLLLPVAVALILGMILPFEPKLEAQSLRTSIGALDVAVAGSAGVAGALSLSGARPGGVVGVMIAVALLPPLVSLGLLLGGGYWVLSIGPLLLAAVNLICINLAGVVTFRVQRIHPRARWKEERAQRASFRALILWFFLLAALVALAFLGEEYWRSFW